MKILIQNYTSALTTESMYLNACFDQTDNMISSYIWDTNNISAFDVIDKVSPNVILCHYNCPSLNDVFKYLSKNKNIDLILNITGIQDNNLKILDNLIEINSISCPFLISNLHEKIHVPKSKNKVLNLLPGVDTFLPKQNIPEFNLEACILSNAKELCEKAKVGYKTFHKVGILSNENEYFDLMSNIVSMTSLYEMYEKIVLALDISVVFSQLFFDAVYKSKKVVLKSNDENKCGEILSNLFESAEEDEDIASSIKNQIKLKHTCYNRASRLARALKHENAAKALQRIGEQL